MLSSDFRRRYLKNFELKKKSRRHLESYLPIDFREEVAPNMQDARMETLARAISNIEKMLSQVAARLNTLRSWVIFVGAFVLALAMYFKH